MKNIFLLLFFLTASLASAQQEANRFGEYEQHERTSKNIYDTSTGATEPEVGRGPGNPPCGEGQECGDPDPVHIDDYLPLLICTGIALILYKTRQKKNLLS